MTDCYFARFDHQRRECNGRIDRCHILPQRIVKVCWHTANPRFAAAWFVPNDLTGTDLDALLADERNIVAGCRRHHQLADAYLIDYERPASAYQFAAELGLSHHLPICEEAA